MKKSKRKGGIVGEQDIDLTPMTDCVFLLLIFFMLTTTLIDTKGLIVDLPTTSQDTQEEQQKKKDVNVLVSAAGEYTVAGNPVSQSQLAEAIKQAMTEANNKNVIIQGSPETSHNSIIYAMDMATSVGAEGMAFSVEQESGQ